MVPEIQWYFRATHVTLEWLFRMMARFLGNASRMPGIYTTMPTRISVVVDDEPAIRSYVSAILQREDFQTVEAESGASGLEIVQQLGNGVALIVSDIQMPDGDGLTFASSIRQTFPDMPIILVSGQVRPDASFEFVQKPFRPSALLQAVHNVMTSRTEQHPQAILPRT
jgi:CheY-like chemotaxis protein